MRLAFDIHECARRLREHRQRFGLTQEQVAAELVRLSVELYGIACPASDRLVRAWENAEQRPGPRYQRLLCTLCAATPEELGFRRPLPVQAVVVAPVLDDEDEDVDLNRKQLFAGLAGALTATVKLPDLAWAGAPRRIGKSDVGRVRQWIDVLWDLEDRHGAAAIRPLALRTTTQLRHLAERATYSTETGRALHEENSYAARLAAWVAYDTMDQEDARHWWLEALAYARLAESEPAAAQVLTVLSQQANRLGQPRQALDWAQAAQRAACAGGTPPHLRSVIVGREAIAHAHLGETAQARRALRRARRLSERTNEPSTGRTSRSGSFWGPGQVAYHEARALPLLGDLNGASDAARTAVDSLTPTASPQVRADCLARLADILVQRGDIDEGVTYARKAGAAAVELDSTRVAGDVRNVASRLAPHQAVTDVRDFIDWTQQSLA